MTFTRKFFTFLTWSAMTVLYHCDTGGPALPPPTGLSYRWLDPFTVNVSWLKPSGLPDGEIWFKCQLMNSTRKPVLVSWTNFTDSLLTEETGSDRWTYHIWTCSDKSCVNLSTPVSITVRTPKPRAKLEDVRCFISTDAMNCSWRPGKQSFNLSYRICGRLELMKGLKSCDRPHSSGIRNGCYMTVDNVAKDICIHVDTEAGMSTFTAERELHSPKLSIREEGDNLELSWTPPDFGRRCTWDYEVCYKKCTEPKVCKVHSSKGEPMLMPYDKSCLYKFQSRVKTNRYCLHVFSDFSDVVIYGANEPPNETLTVVAIVVPIILSACIILSCYCFRRHSSIICPVIPDPSAIFKEMMMNGNKELKNPTGSLYTPVPEPIEPCRITLVTENSVLEQNS